MSKIKWVSAAIIAGSCVFATQAAMAYGYGAGDFFVRGGVAKVTPKSDNGEALGQDVDVGDENGFTYGLGYLFHDKFGVELNSSEAFQHDLSLGGSDLGTIDRIPVNLMVNYYPLGGLDSRVQPYVGAGLNYTNISGEPADIDARRSYGAVGQVGLDLAVTENVMLNGFANYADVDSELRMNGEEIGTAKIDPLTIGGGVTFRF